MTHHTRLLLRQIRAAADAFAAFTESSGLYLGLAKNSQFASCCGVSQVKRAFESKIFKMDSKLVDIFVEHFDGNQVHRVGNSNEILPKNTVPGMMVVSMAAKAALQIEDFKEILCARGFSVKFHSPVFRDDELVVRGTYEDSPHKERPGVIFRVNNCEIINSSNQKKLISYEITQLLRKP